MTRALRSIVFVVTLASAQSLIPAKVQLKYLGTAGWEITDGRTTLLVDPYLSRLNQRTPNDDVL
ncbi:MAG TPA: hypothetical protein VEK56_11060, partial [Vicinamibacterales bacterium]|nr:hypothetical protein [Vicinamibacterales bacterium]